MGNRQRRTRDSVRRNQIRKATREIRREIHARLDLLFGVDTRLVPYTRINAQYVRDVLTATFRKAFRPL